MGGLALSSYVARARLLKRHVKIGLLYIGSVNQSESIHDFTAGFSQYFDKIIGHGDAQIKEVCFISTTIVISIGSVNHYTIALISDSTPIYLISRFYY